MIRNRRTLLLLTLVLFFAAEPAHAGGLWLYELATPDMGVGGAGREAAGLDASTAGGNPAAMTRLDRSQMEGGILGIYPDSKFDVKSASFGENGGGTAGYFSAIPTLYYVYSVNPDLKLRQLYLPKFRAVLPDKKVARYYQLENKIDAVVRFELAAQIPLFK